MLYSQEGITMAATPKFKAIKNVSKKNETMTCKCVYNLKSHQYVITKTEDANDLLRDFPHFLVEFGKPGWADEVMKGGTLELGNPYYDPEDPEPWDDEVTEVPVSPIEIVGEKEIDNSDYAHTKLEDIPTTPLADYTNIEIAQPVQEPATEYSGVGIETPTE